MTKEEFIKAQEELRARYIKESNILGSMWLSWVQKVDNNGNLVSEWVEIFKVISANIENDEILIDTVEIGGVLKDFEEIVNNNPKIILIDFRNVDTTRSGLNLSKDCGYIQIDDNDYEKLKYILYQGDSDFSPKQRFEEAVSYLDLCGFERYEIILTKV